MGQIRSDAKHLSFEWLEVTPSEDSPKANPVFYPFFWQMSPVIRDFFVYEILCLYPPIRVLRQLLHRSNSEY